MIERTFIPFDKWLPDAAALNNPGLRKAWGVVPLYGNYLASPGLHIIGDDLETEPLGFHLHHVAAATLGFSGVAYYGDATKLWEVARDDGAKTDKSRLAGGAYSFGSLVPYWSFTSYGSNIIATNYNDDVQYLPTPATANFAKLITSTFEPKFRFVFSIGQNLFGANCNIGTTYDGIPTGANPQLVVWSQNRNLRAFGSENIDPQLVGAGWNDLLNDFGPITAAVGGGEFGVVFQPRGHVRISGPPYEFAARRRGGCIQPSSIVRIGDDIYFWGQRGPSLLRREDDEIRVLADRTASRSLLDRSTGFSAIAAIVSFQGGFRNQRIHAAVDEVNGVIRWSYQPNGGFGFEDTVSPQKGGAFIDYNYLEDRLSVSPIREGDYPDTAEIGRVYGMGSLAQGDGDAWLPFNQTFGIRQRFFDLGSTEYHLFSFNNAGAIPQPKADITFQTGLGKLSEVSLSRILRVRPVYATDPGTSPVTTKARISSVNNPQEDETYFPSVSTYFTATDDEGYIVCADKTLYADYHSIEIVIDPDETGDGRDIWEIEGVEVEFDVSRTKKGAPA